MKREIDLELKFNRYSYYFSNWTNKFYLKACTSNFYNTVNEICYVLAGSFFPNLSSDFV